MTIAGNVAEYRADASRGAAGPNVLRRQREPSVQTPVRVLCVDDNELVADSVRRRLQMEPAYSWAGWFRHTDELLADGAARAADVILLDIDMPGQDTFGVVRRLGETAPDARVVMFSGYVRSDYIDRAIEAGAWGYISKNDGIDEVLDAVRQVALGEFALSRDAFTEQGRSVR